MKAEQYISQVAKLDKLIANKMIEKEQWHAIATSTTASLSDGDRVQSSGNPQKMAEAVHKMIEIQDEIDEAIEKYIAIKHDVIKTIEKLPVIEYDIIHKLYIQGIDAETIAGQYGMSKSWV
ncbi:MAG: hypothetical protein HUJ53_01595, partial [Holdemanella sp.]|nr:hypothetical protein [Holdemanella sp.]